MHDKLNYAMNCAIDGAFALVDSEAMMYVAGALTVLALVVLWAL